MRSTGRSLLFTGATLHAIVAAVIGFVAFPAGEPLGILLSLVGAWGAFLGFVAFREALRDRHRQAFKAGMLSSLLPPLNVLTFAGALLVRAAR
jgi:hypothetical protein